MSWDISVVGTIHLDDITTPRGHKPRLLGGSAVYFALAACPQAKIHLHGAVGADSAQEFRDLLAHPNIVLDGLEVSQNPTFHWHATHDFEAWIAIETGADPGCDADWSTTLSPAAIDSEILFIGSMNPALQSQVLQHSKAKLVGIDTMVGFIERDYDAVVRAVEGAHILFVNESELRALSQNRDDWKAAAQSWIGRGNLRALVVKHGPNGAACVTKEGVIELPPDAVESVVDPTGAGDSLAGGFLGACAAAERDDAAFFEIALRAGLRTAALAVSSFGTNALASNSAIVQHSSR